MNPGPPQSVRISRVQCAFTLVELLVVIGILALMIAILLPILAGARRESQRAKCLSNLRQIGFGFQLYSGENHGYWPMAYYRCAPPGANDSILEQRTCARAWYHFISRYITSNGQVLNPDGKSIDAQKTVKNGESIIWGCPNWNRSILAGASYVYDSDLYTGYAMNAYPFAPAPVVLNGGYSNIVFRGGAGFDPIHTSGWFYQAARWARPAQRALVLDGYFYVAEMTPNWPFWKGDPMPAMPDPVVFPVDYNRHAKYRAMGQFAKTVNMLYCDGHAETVSPREAHHATWFSPQSAP